MTYRIVKNTYSDNSEFFSVEIEMYLTYKPHWSPIKTFKSIEEAKEWLKIVNREIIKSEVVF